MAAANRGAIKAQTLGDVKYAAKRMRINICLRKSREDHDKFRERKRSTPRSDPLPTPSPVLKLDVGTEEAQLMKLGGTDAGAGRGEELCSHVPLCCKFLTSSNRGLQQVRSFFFFFA